MQEEIRIRILPCFSCFALNPLYHYIAMYEIRLCRMLLVQLMTEIPGGRIPRSVGVTDLLDQTVKYFSTDCNILRPEKERAVVAASSSGGYYTGDFQQNSSQVGAQSTI